jgi:serine/threonine protein kinase|tara:strand:- start:5058 stop:6305 length:1248 start_codon:yes stop_codon:yes gene_type:complete
MKRGGKYLGKGTYGCVFSPPLNCVDDDNQTQHVGKIFFNKEAAEEELKVTNSYVKSIDPEGEFTNMFVKQCDLTKQKFEEILKKNPQFLEDNVNLIEECSVNEEQTIQLIYMHKGESLEKIINEKVIQPLEYKEIFYYLLPLIKGLVKMDDKKIMHRDIKPDNIIRTENKHILFIDFGLAIEYDKAFMEEEDYVLGHNYPYYPPEFNLRNELFKYEISGQHSPLRRIPSEDRFLDDCVKKCLMNYKGVFSKKRVKFSKLNQNLKKIGDHIKEFYRKVINEINVGGQENPDIIETIFNKYSSKVDIFSFGMVLLEIFDMCFTKKSLAVHIPTDEFKENMIYIINCCIKMDPDERISAEELYREYTELVKNHVTNNSKRYETRIQTLQATEGTKTNRDNKRNLTAYSSQPVKLDTKR